MVVAVVVVFGVHYRWLLLLLLLFLLLFVIMVAVVVVIVVVVVVVVVVVDDIAVVVVFFVVVFVFVILIVFNGFAVLYDAAPDIKRQQDCPLEVHQNGKSLNPLIILSYGSFTKTDDFLMFHFT